MAGEVGREGILRDLLATDAEAVDFFLERDDLGPCLLESANEPLVVFGHSGQLRLRCR